LFPEQDFLLQVLFSLSLKFCPCKATSKYFPVKYVIQSVLIFCTKYYDKKLKQDAIVQIRLMTEEELRTQYNVKKTGRYILATLQSLRGPKLQPILA
jgi:hypothetical protein